MINYAENIIKVGTDNKKFCFTLAEVLITLGIIGFVAAITIPALVAHIGNIVKNHQTTVIENRLLSGLNKFNTMEWGLSKRYTNTKEFVQGLSKHYKMVQICGNDELANCFPYEKINYTTDNGAEQINVSDLKYARNLGFNDDEYHVPAAFINAQGTPFLISIKKDCPTDSDRSMRSLEAASCIVGVYDYNGAHRPNKYGTIVNDDGVKNAEADIIPINGGRVGDGVFMEINGVKFIGKFFFPKDKLSSSYDCNTEKNMNETNYTINQCPVVNNQDYWGQAMYYCHGMGGHMMNTSEYHAIFKHLFKDDNGNHPIENTWQTPPYHLDTELLSELGMKNWDGSDVTENKAFVPVWVSNNDDGLYYYQALYRHGDEQPYGTYITYQAACVKN